MYLKALVFINSILLDRRGVTAIEYGLIAGLIGVAIIGAVTVVGTDLQTLFTTVGTKLSVTLESIAGSVQSHRRYRKSSH